MTMLPLELKLYGVVIATSFIISLILTPLIRMVALKWKVLDHAHAGIKTHKVPTPVLGGISVFLAFVATLIIIRYWTHFPTGTLRNLRAILIGGSLVFLVGLVDDLKKPVGLSWKLKFFTQMIAAGILVYQGLSIQFIKPNYMAIVITVIWVVGVTNSINIVDIMDGLSATVVIVAALGFLWVAMPSESIYVNFAAAALIGSAGGFLPYNLSKGKKIFVGDGGSLFMGFVLAALSLGTQYSNVNPLGVYAAIFILGIPIFDTFFVMIMRIRRGRSPFLGSRDHFAFRLEAIGFSRMEIVGLCAVAGTVLSFCAFLATQLSWIWGVWIYVFVGGEFLLLSSVIAKVKVD